MTRLLACLIVIACAAGCSDDPTGPESEPLVIAGAVTDADGNPVADALILLDLAVESVDKAAAMPPATAIRINMPEHGPVQLAVLNSCRTDTFEYRELDLEGGEHVILFDGMDADGRHLTDQSLWFVVTTPESTSEIEIVLMRNIEGEDGNYGNWDHAFVRDNVRIQATTDADGWFTITDPCVGFGTSFTATNEMGEVIGDMQIAWRVRAWAYQADHASGATSNWRDVDPESGATVSVIMGD